MNLLESIILGIIQGVTEWLPISSEGISTLVMMNFFKKSFSDSIFFSIWLHLGTVLAAIVYFNKDIFLLFKNLKKYIRQPKINNQNNRLTNFLIISTILSIIIAGILFILNIDSLDDYGKIAIALIGFFLLITGIIQLIAKKQKLIKKIKIKDSILVGIIQGFSIIPGLSRSGLTVSTLLLRKYSSKAALKLSFLMSIPFIIIGEFGLLVMNKIQFTPYSLVAVLFSFIFGLLTLKYLLKLANKLNFGYFCIFFGLIAILAFIV